MLYNFLFHISYFCALKLLVINVNYVNIQIYLKESILKLFLCTESFITTYYFNLFVL